MNKLVSILGFIGFIIVIVVIVIVIYLVFEKKKKDKIKKEFKEFTSNFSLSNKDLRTVPRISIPNSLEVILTFSYGKHKELKSYAVNMSLSGIAVKLDFSLKKLPLNATLENVSVKTPINNFIIKELKQVRIESRAENKLLAFKIVDISEDQFEELKSFMSFLYKFLKNGKKNI